MLVDSSGSTNPLASPRATTFLFQTLLRLPVLNLMTRGLVIVLPSTSCRSRLVASSSDMKRLQYTSPLPTRCWSGMHQRQPAAYAVERVYGAAGRTDSVCTGTALSHGSQCDQSS